MQIARTWTKHGRSVGGRARWLSLLAPLVALSRVSWARASSGDAWLESALAQHGTDGGGCGLRASGSASVIGWLLATLIITSLLARRTRPRVPRSKRRRNERKSSS
jgi:hypothetical protein